MEEAVLGINIFIFSLAAFFIIYFGIIVPKWLGPYWDKQAKKHR